MIRICAALVVVMAGATAVRADIILSSAVLNDALKNMERLRQQAAAGAPAERAEALFAFGTEADALAELLTAEVAAHGSQEKALIDLAIARTGEMGAAIAYNREKKKFFYDNAAFTHYVETFPRGRQAAHAEFKLIEGDYFQSSAAEIEKVRAASARKQAFLGKYPRFARNSEVSLMLSIDYRDLYRHYRQANDAANRDRYVALTRKQLTATIGYKGSEESPIAAEILKRFNAETGK